MQQGSQAGSSNNLHSRHLQYLVSFFDTAQPPSVPLPIISPGSQLRPGSSQQKQQLLPSFL